MSCRTAYLVRETDQSTWFAAGKGTHEINDAADRDSLGLSVGHTATAIVKASDIIVAVD
jgi:hypothetical protein